MAKQLRLKQNATLEELDDFYTDVINANFQDVIEGDPFVKPFKRSQFNDAISTLAKIKEKKAQMASKKAIAKPIKVEFVNANTMSERSRIDRLQYEVDESLGLTDKNNA